MNKIRMACLITVLLSASYSHGTLQDVGVTVLAGTINGIGKSLLYMRRPAQFVGAAGGIYHAWRLPKRTEKFSYKQVLRAVAIGYCTLVAIDAVRGNYSCSSCAAQALSTDGPAHSASLLADR